MTQRIRSCSNSTNLDTINCESYMTRLVNHDKMSKSKKERVLPTKSKTQTQVKPPRTKPPLVEVTVHTRPKSNREPWNKLLKLSASATSTTFDQFDPLRTIHFLSKELQTKLKSDPQVLNMLITMQQALERIPPDVSTSKTSIKRSAEDVPEKLVLVNKSCQTINTLSYTDSEIFQKKLESSTAKLESSCKQMEILCEELKNDKQYVEELLQAETNKVVHLKQRLEEAQSEKNKFSNAAFEKVVKERQELEVKLRQMKANLSSYHGPSIQELKGRVQDLQMQKVTLEQDNIVLRHKLASADMEREKYVTLLRMRDRQINEILNEMNCLQEVVSEQLVQLQKVPLDSAPSSQSTIIEIPSCPTLKNESKELLKNQDVMDFPLHQLYSKALRELESGDSSVTNVLPAISQKKAKSASFFPKDNVEVASLFNEVKQQALNLPAGNNNSEPSTP